LSFRTFCTPADCDEYFTVLNIVRPSETIHSTAYDRRPGGKGANQAVSVARAGGRVSILGSVGKDGAWVVNLIEETGVDVSRVIELEDVRSIIFKQRILYLSYTSSYPLDVQLFS
jgi:sugar/nucleoside kinase (ribokinase family)